MLWSVSYPLSIFLFRALMDNWLACAKRLTGSRGWYTTGDHSALEVASVPARVEFEPGAKVGSVVIKSPLLKKRAPCCVSDLVWDIVESNPTVDAFHLQLRYSDRAELVEVLTSQGAKASNGTRRYWHRPSPEGHHFASTIPKTEKAKWCTKEEQMVSRQYFFKETDLETILPIYSLKSTIGLEWETEIFGHTTPLTYGSGSVGGSLPFPYQALPPLIGQNDPIVDITTAPPVINHAIEDVLATGHVHLRGVPGLRDLVAGMAVEFRAQDRKNLSHIFNHNFPSPVRGSDPPNRGVIYGTIPDHPFLPKPHPRDPDPMDLPVLSKFGDLVLQKFAKTGVTFHLMAIGYVHVVGDKVQHLHRDIRRGSLPANAYAFSCFSPVNLDLRKGDGSLSHFVWDSTEGFPRPWHEVNMPMDRGDMWALRSDMIHAGGAVPPAAMKQGIAERVMCFAAIATISVQYSATFGVVRPFYVGSDAAARQQAHGNPKCGHDGCNRTPARTPALCFGCQRNPLCSIHAGGECSACGTPGDNATEAAPVQASSDDSLGATVFNNMITCLIPLDNTALYTIHGPEQEPVRTGEGNTSVPPTPEACPGRAFHECAILPMPDSAEATLATRHMTMLVIVRGQWGGVAVNEDPHMDTTPQVVRCDILPPSGQLVDPSVLEAAGVITKNDNSDGYWCACHQVYAPAPSPLDCRRP